MLRSIIAVIVAVVTWFVVATIGNWILRLAIPGYSAVEVSMHFTLTMMISRLVLGLVSSLGAGFVCGKDYAKPDCLEGCGSHHGDSVSAGSLHALGQVSDLVPPVLFDYARSGGFDWRSPRAQFAPGFIG